ncbi:MAG: peptide chain release factor N(5)-glutamine methyltransferase [Mariprofundus sp.]|nr:peptide chain release factor N(5)-glutamine methyltransferase [Mariprofundus sp.]
MNIRTLLRESAEKLMQAGCDAPRLDAELLLMHLCSCSRTDLIIRANDKLTELVQAHFSSLLQRRIKREPLAYIIGEKEFWSRAFYVNPDVLVPRPETEHLIEAVLTCLPDPQQHYHFCDIGTGSGCIAITLAAEYPQTIVTAMDISAASLKIAQRNAATLNVTARIRWHQGDMLQPLTAEDGLFDIIISNPPYVTASEMYELEPELSLEPRHALTDESNGLKFLTTILQNAPVYLKQGGYIIVETGSCGLPSTPPTLILKQEIYDLAGLLRGAIYQHADLPFKTLRLGCRNSSLMRV